MAGSARDSALPNASCLDSGDDDISCVTAPVSNVTLERRMEMAESIAKKALFGDVVTKTAYLMEVLDGDGADPNDKTFILCTLQQMSVAKTPYEAKGSFKMMKQKIKNIKKEFADKSFENDSASATHAGATPAENTATTLADATLADTALAEEFAAATLAPATLAASTASTAEETTRKENRVRRSRIHDAAVAVLEAFKADPAPLSFDNLKSLHWKVDTSLSRRTFPSLIHTAENDNDSDLTLPRINL